MITKYLLKAVENRNLTESEAERAMDAIISGETTDIQIGAFIAAMTTKGTTPEEIAAFTRAMMNAAVKICPEVDGRLVDTCGTGGDGSDSFNISTASALVSAGAKIPIVKHGNRSVTSRCGSADVLEQLGVNIEASPEVAKYSIENAGIGFLNAKTHHSAMKYAAKAREEIGIRSFFNILGPLSNPAFAPSRLLGVYDPELTVPIAETLRILGVENAMVVHGSGLDEITTTGETQISFLRKTGSITTYTIVPEEFGISQADISDISGGDAARNAKIIMEILEGEHGACRDIVLLNAAAAIYLGGGAESMKEGVKQAERSIDSGRAAEKLMKLIEITGERI